MKLFKFKNCRAAQKRRVPHIDARFLPIKQRIINISFWQKDSIQNSASHSIFNYIFILINFWCQSLLYHGENRINYWKWTRAQEYDLNPQLLDHPEEKLFDLYTSPLEKLFHNMCSYYVLSRETVSLILFSETNKIANIVSDGFLQCSDSGSPKSHKVVVRIIILWKNKTVYQFFVLTGSFYTKFCILKCTQLFFFCSQFLAPHHFISRRKIKISENADNRSAFVTHNFETIYKKSIIPIKFSFRDFIPLNVY